MSPSDPEITGYSVSVSKQNVSYNRECGIQEIQVREIRIVYDLFGDIDSKIFLPLYRSRILD